LRKKGSKSFVGNKKTTTFATVIKEVTLQGCKSSFFDLDIKKPLMAATIRGRAKAKAIARSNRTAQNYGFFL